MADFNANLGSVTAQEKIVLAGDGVVRSYPLKAGQADLDAGTLVALDAALEVVPYDEAQTEQVATGDGAAATFALEIAPRLVPGSVTITDGVETFADDGFGGLTGDAGGSGQINYRTGDATVTFNAAPAADAAINATYKGEIYGVLERDAVADAGHADVIRQGRVNRQELLVGGVAADVVVLAELDANYIFPVG